MRALHLSTKASTAAMIKADINSKAMVVDKALRLALRRPIMDPVTKLINSILLSNSSMAITAAHRAIKAVRRLTHSNSSMETNNMETSILQRRELPTESVILSKAFSTVSSQSVSRDRAILPVNQVNTLLELRTTAA